MVRSLGSNLNCWVEKQASYQNYCWFVSCRTQQKFVNQYYKSGLEDSPHWAVKATAVGKKEVHRISPLTRQGVLGQWSEGTSSAHTDICVSLKVLCTNLHEVFYSPEKEHSKIESS